MSQAFTVEITPAALADLAEIRDWLTQEAGIDVADALIDAVLERIDTLERFPLRGPTVPELSHTGEGGARQLPAGPYRLLYEVAGEAVTILAVVHVRRDLRAALEHRLLRPGRAG